MRNNGDAGSREVKAHKIPGYEMCMFYLYYLVRIYDLCPVLE